MVHWVTSSCILSVLVAVPPTGLFAQAPSGAGPNTYRTNPDPRVRRAQREAAVVKAGPNAPAFVEAQGDESVAAIYACSNAVAVKLAEFHSSGEMAKLARPRDLLCIIAQPRHGDDVAVWAMQHARELQDTDSFDAFLVSPLEYALGLKQLTTGAAEAKTRRLNRNALAKRPTLTSLSADQKQVIFGIAGFLLLVGLAMWLRKRSLIC
jgi:hypothetical protein